MLMACRFPVKPCALLLLCLWLGCVHSQSARPGELANTAPSVSMEISALKPQREQPFALRVAGTLYSGDRFAVQVESSSLVYLYLFRRTAPGTLVPVFPEAGQSPPPHTTLRLPDSRGWYRLDQEVGTEQLFLVVSSAPLSIAQATEYARAQAQQGGRGAEEVLGATSQSEAPVEPPPPPPPPPPPSSASAAPIVDEDTRHPFIVRAPLPASGVAVLVFPFEHK